MYKEFQLNFLGIGLFTVFRIFLFTYGVFMSIGEGKCSIWVLMCAFGCC